MSIRENIEIYHSLDLEKYLEVLKREFGSRKHPSQENVWIADDLPFYAPKHSIDHVFLLGFNKVPLPYSIIQALINHPELAPDNVTVRWTQEQELLFEGTLGELRQQQKIELKR